MMVDEDEFDEDGMTMMGWGFDKYAVERSYRIRVFFAVWECHPHFCVKISNNSIFLQKF